MDKKIWCMWQDSEKYLLTVMLIGPFVFGLVVVHLIQIADPPPLN